MNGMGSRKRAHAPESFFTENQTRLCGHKINRLLTSFITTWRQRIESRGIGLVAYNVTTPDSLESTESQLCGALTRHYILKNHTSYV